MSDSLDRFPDPSTLPDAELDELLHAMESKERSLSRRRSVLHDRIDFVAAGGAQNGVAESQMAALQVREREIAQHRHTLHVRIDALRLERGRRRDGRERA